MRVGQLSKSPGFHWGWEWGLFCGMGGSLIQATGSLVTLGVLVGFASDRCIYLYSVLCVKCLLFEDELSRP